MLLLAWSLFQTYYGVADDGTSPDEIDPEDPAAVNDEDEYYRTLAHASLDLLERIKHPGTLTTKQVMRIRTALQLALKQKGAYQPPVIVWALRNDGTRRRVFASLRLRAYARLLRSTRPM